MEEVINIEEVPQYPGFYPAVDHVFNVFTHIPFIKDITYFKLQMSRNPEIIDVIGD